VKKKMARAISVRNGFSVRETKREETRKRTYAWMRLRRTSSLDKLAARDGLDDSRLALSHRTSDCRARPDIASQPLDVLPRCT
jgi:hypothetical protein